MLSGSPELISILANSGDVVYSPNSGGQAAVLHTSPREFDLTFNQGTVLDPTTLSGVQVVGAGADGTLNTADDVPIQPGYIGLGGTPNEIVLRFSQTLPDGLYAVNLVGAGPGALSDTNSPPDFFSSGNPIQPNLQVRFSVDTPPQVLSVVPEPVQFDSASGQLKQVTNEIDVYFDKAIKPLPQTINQLDPAQFQLIYTAGTANTSDDVSFRPSSVSFDASTNKATLLFNDASGSPQPLDQLLPANANLGTFATQGTFRLRIGNDQVVSGNGGINNMTPMAVPITEPGSTFGDTQQPALAPYDTGILDSDPHQIIQTSLGATNVSPGLAFPGGNYGPGVQTTPYEHVIDFSASPLSVSGPPAPGTVATFTYNFPNLYGSTPSNPQLQNVITTQQEALARQIFQLWSNYLGVQFKEVSNETMGAADLGIVTGLVQAVDPTAPANLQAIAGTASFNGQSENLAIISSPIFSTESQYGGPWFTAAMQQIGHLLGLGFNSQDPAGTVMGAGGNDPATGAAPEPVFPTNADILHGQYIYRPQSDNVDIYRFTVNSSGTFNGETIAQRLTDANGNPTPSGLNTVLTLYGQTNLIQLPAGGAVVDGSTFTLNDGVHPPVGFEFVQNPRGPDGFVHISYSAGDSANTIAGNVANAINNNVQTSGLNASATVQFNQVVLNGPLTVTSSGNQGGVTYTVSRQIIARNDDYFGSDSFVNLHLAPGVYYVGVTSTGNTQFDPSVPGSGAGGTTQGPYDLKLDFTPDPLRNLTDVDGTSLQGNSKGNSGGAYDFWFNVGSTIFVDKAPPASAGATTDGSLAHPYSNVGQALQVAADRIIAPGGDGSYNGLPHDLDGQTFVVNDGFDPPVTFEFAADGRQLNDNNVAVNFISGNVAGTLADSNQQVATDIANAIDSSPNPLQVMAIANGYVVDLVSKADGVTPVPGSSVDTLGAPALLAATKMVRVLGGAGADNSIGVPVNATGPIVSAGNTFQITAGTVSSTFEFFNGDALEVSAANGGGIADRSTFSIKQGSSTVTFEFAANGRTVFDGNVPVSYKFTDSKAMLGAEIAQAINAAAGQFGTNSPVSASYSGIGPDGNAVVSIGSDANTSYAVALSGLVLKAAATKMAIQPGVVAVHFATTDSAATLAQEIAAAVNASPLTQIAGGDVAASVTTNAVAYTNGDAWFVNLSGVGPISINAQATPKLVAVSNEQPYEIGHSQFGGTPLADGATMDVPQGTTVMVDAGSVFKLEGANISVGVSTPSVDRSNAALQVLGTPTSSVFFTSFHDNSLGTTTDTVTSPAGGDWGGIVFGQNADLEQQGIFLDSVNHARLTYGGGSVLVNGQQAVPYTPIYLAGSRPSITNNTILLSNNAAISADPNSFGETIFGSPAFNAADLQPPVQTAATVSAAGGTLAAGTYYYEVTAVGPAGETAASNEVSVTVSGTTSEVTVNWNAVAGATGYKIYRGTTSGGENQLVGIVSGGTATSFVDNGTVILSGQSPPLRQAYISDYERAGPDIAGNTLAINQPGAQLLNAAAANQIVPGETFVITTPGAVGGLPTVGVNNVFEFVNKRANRLVAPGQLLADGNFAVLVDPGAPAVGATPASPPETATQVAAEIASAIQAAKIGVSASVVGTTSQVSIGGATAITPSTPSSFTAPTGAQLVDGETFVVTNLTTGAQTTFEFDNNGQVVAGNVAVTFTTKDTAATVAGSMVAAINGASIGVFALVQGNLVLLKGSTTFQFAGLAGFGIISSGTDILLTASGATMQDGTKFVINNSVTGAAVTFEYHLSTDATPVVAGHIPIVYSIRDTASAVAAETAAAINQAGLSVEAISSGDQVELVGTPSGKFGSPLSVASTVVANTINGIFVRTQDPTTQAPEALSVAARWTATDIPYVLSGNLVLQGNPGGILDNAPRLSGRLDVDPGVTVKLANARIETDMGGNLIAEGTASEPIVFTSLHDQTYGGGGTFATDGVPANTSSPQIVAAPGNWAGLYFAPTSRGSLDHTMVAYAGGNSTVQGNSDVFDAVEIHQATVRIADSTIENNAAGLATASRGDLLGNAAAAIYVLGAQPVIVNNVFQNNRGATISIDANSLTSAIAPDPGRSTGPISRFTQFDNNDGPLVRLNKIGNVVTNVGAINGMLVRGGTLDTQSVWDDADIVHVVESLIDAPNVDARGGLLLESSSSESLVVKFEGGTAGITATGTPLDITNRVGGSVQILGTPQHNVVLTALSDETVGAGLTPDGRPNVFTDNGMVPAASDIFTPMVDVFPTSPKPTNQWFMTANNAGTISVSVFDQFGGGSISIDGGGPVTTAGNGFTKVTLNGVAPGSQHVFHYTIGGAGAQQLANHYRADFSGVSQVYVDESQTSPDDVADPQVFGQDQDMELGFDSRFNTLPSAFADTTWYYSLNLGDTMTWHGYFGPSGGADAAKIELVDPTGKVRQVFNQQPLLAGNGTTITIKADEAGFWGVKLTAPAIITPIAGHYLETVSVTDAAGNLVPSETARNYLLSSSFLNPAAEWQGITLDQYSNDTNVATVNESEPAYTSGVGTNELPSTAQSLGQLASSTLGGDDTHRLGFTVNGTISPNFAGDVDTYTFQAQPGTQVWFNLGNTSPGLDSVLELVSANGTVLARSDNALDEANNPSLLQQALPGNVAQPLADGTLLGGNNDPQVPGLTNTTIDPNSLQYPSLRNQFSSNPLDAGFRVTLPGTPNGTTASNYYIRVYSKNTVGSGQSQYVPGLGTSSGAYQLQIRLQETRQYAGSTVQYADIRFATNGITLEGQPADSPLVGDAAQNPTPTTTDASSANQPSPLPNAQDLGNLLSTNQGAINVAGNIGAAAQVTWYKFETNYNLLQAIAGLNDGAKSVSAIFDVNFADGLPNRPNTTISVFDSTGTLIYVGRGSNAADDQTSNMPSGTSNLSFGSYGQLDPYIGSVQLPAGAGSGSGTQTYYVAISSDAALPAALNATYSAGGANGLVRLEPVDSINRLVEDHIGSQGGETAQPASSLTALFNGSVNTTDANFAAAAQANGPVLTTAQQAQQLMSLNTSAVQFSLSDVVLFVDQGKFGNIAGHLETVNPYTGAKVTDVGATAGTGNGYDDVAMRNDGQLFSLTLGPTDASAGRYDLISTANGQATPFGADGITTSQIVNGKPAAQNIGVQIHALAFLQNGTTRELFAVGSYAGGAGAPPFINGLYELDPNTGAVLTPPGQVNPGAGANPSPTLLNPAGVGTFEQITGLAVINNLLYAVTDQGGLYIINNPGGPASMQFVAKITGTNGNSVSFTSLTNGPPNVQNGAFAGDLFAADSGGNLWAFNTSGVLQPIFANSQASIPLGVTNVTGLAFSTLDYNLWHVTDALANQPGHGINGAPDQSRNPSSDKSNQPQAGNLSYYFGLEDPNAPGVLDTAPNTTLQPGAENYSTSTSGANGGNIYGTYNLPGGALGSLKTAPFSLASYNAGDAPTLYFNYLLNSGQPTTGFKSSARVQISTDGGLTWGDELATNDPTRANYNSATDPFGSPLGARQNTQPSELPGFDSASARAPATTLGGQPAVDPRQQVQQLFDGSSSWLQARIDLSNYAGKSNLMLRFDFSSAGSMNQGVPGDKFGNFTSNTRGQNNAFTGFYVDDVTVGFAGRGEMVTGSTSDTTYFATPQSTNLNVPTQQLTGPYQLDIRSGTPYAVTPNPSLPDIQLVHSYDVNDRLNDAFTIAAPAGGALADGQTFQVNDGVHVVTFEFDNNGSLQTAGAAKITFQTTNTSVQIAQQIAAAVNTNTTLKGVRATVTAGNRVDFFGAVSVSSVNAVSGSLTVTAADQSITETGPTNSTTVTISRTNLSPSALGNTVAVQLQAIDVVGRGASQNLTLTDTTTNTKSQGGLLTVLIPAGQTFVNVTVTGMKPVTGAGGPPELADGPQKVQIVATANGYGSSSNTLDVVDDAGVVPTLTVAITNPTSHTIVENAGPNAATGTVTRNSPDNVPLVVTLTSLDPASAKVPATVTIPAGSFSATFNIDAVDDNVSRQQPVNVTIVASAANFNSGSASIAVRDDGDTSQVPLGTPLWTAQGPAPITGGLESNISQPNPNGTPGTQNNPVSGGVETVLVDPADPTGNTIFIGTVNGGIWETTNALSASGPTWTPLTDKLPSLSIGALQFDLSDGTFSTMIAGIGAFSSLDAVGSNRPAGGKLAGLMQSSDGGQKWSILPVLPTSLATPVGQNISGVAERGNVIMAAANASFGNAGGLLRSIDGGSNFTLVSTLPTSGLPAGPVTDLVGDPIDHNRFYVAVLGPSGGIFTSDNAGATWTDVTPTGLRPTLNANPVGDTIRIADSGKAVDIGYEKFNSANNQTTLAAIYQSPAVNLSSATWTLMDLPTSTENGTVVGLNSVGAGYLSIAADPTNPNVVYVGGDQQPGPFPNTEGATAATGRIFRGDVSRPTGSQWTDITDNNANGTAPPADSRSLAFDGAQLLETDDGGVYALSNPSTTGTSTPSGSWTSLVGNLAVTEIHNIAYDTNTNTLLAGAVADAGTPEQSATGSQTWFDYSQGDGGDVAVDNQVPVGSPPQSIRYTSSAFLNNFEATSYDSQGNIINVINPALSVGGIPLNLVDTSLPRVTTFVLNSQPGTSGWMVFGAENAVYESFDGGQTLASLGGGGAGAGALFGAAMAYGGVSGGVSNPYVLWVGVGAKVFLRSSQFGALAATNYTGGTVQSLAINPNNWRNAFIVDGSGHVWQTVNGGATYQDVTGNLVGGASGLTADLHSVAFVPGNATNNLVYVGARDGVYQMQTSSPGTWVRYGALMPNVPVYDLKYVANEQLLVAGTLGRGAFTASAIGAAGDIVVNVNQVSVTDDGGQITGTVTRSGTFGNLTVVLNSSDSSLVPTTNVTIPDGQTSANFSINVNDLTDASGNEVAFSRETVILTPQAGGLNPVSAFVNVNDDSPSGVPASDDLPALSITLATNQLDPNAGITSVTGTVSRNTPTDQPLTVYLVSSDTTRASVPQVVTIPANQSSVTFTVTDVDQFANDGQPHNVIITAAAQTYQGLEITGDNGSASDTLVVQPTRHIVAYNRQGDTNVVPQQGQIVIQDNRISNSLDFAVVLQAAPRAAGGSIPYPGAPINLTTINTDPNLANHGVAPGATVTNNLLVGNTQGGISVSGDPDTGNVPAAVVPIARILNNTVYGSATPTGVGVQVGQNASPTILNNIFANLATGVSVDNTSSSTVLEGSVYQNNGVDLTGNVFNGGDVQKISLSPTAALFTSPATNDFYLAPGSAAIDSGINQLQERPDLTSAKSLTGIPPSSTNSPSYDLYGQLRAADPESNPNGVGSNFFIDRGAIERIDFTGPTSTLLNPVDNGSADQDAALNVVHEIGNPLANFTIQLKDTNGSGIDDSTVTSSKFDVYRNGVQLTEGIDYYFQYDTNTKTVYLVPVTGVWATGNQYTIFVDNGVLFDANSKAAPVGIKDIAGNLLQANSATGYTRYDIQLQGPTGDAPSVGVPPVQTVNENGDIATSLTFSGANAITIFDIDAPNDTVTVTMTATNGTLSLADKTGVTVAGDKSSSLTITGTVPNVNAALNGIPAQNGQAAVPGLTFTPTFDYSGAAMINITVTDPLLGLSGSGTVNINVAPVNQKPVINVPATQSVTENPPQALVFSLANGNPITISDPDGGTGVEQVSINVPNGTVTLSQTTGLGFAAGENGVGESAMTFSGTLANINAALDGLQYVPANNFTGLTTIDFTVNDNGNNPPPAAVGTGSATINVIPVNQPPYVIKSIPAVVVNETNQTGVTTVIDLSQYISDPDVNNNPPEAPPTLTVVGNSNPTMVTATISGHLLTLTYAPYQFGTASITIQAIDNNVGPTHPSVQTSFNVTVSQVEYPPTAANDEYVFTPGVTLIVTAPGVLANDVDHNGNTLRAVITQVPDHGKLNLQNDGSFTYTPDAGFNGRDSFDYVADDGQGNRVPATVFLDTPNSRWVARMYTEVLGRSQPPADSEVNFWVNQLNSGMTRQQVSINFVTSPERRDTIINQLYEQYLGRPADAGGLNYWLGVWEANNGPEQVQAGIIGSAEYFQTAGGTPQAWVTKLYQNLLDRNPAPSEVAFWTNYIQSNPRGNVVLGFVTSDEYRLDLLQGIPNDPNMLGFYEQFLHRPIDPGGAQFWLHQMKIGYPQEAILEGILGSDEYYNRA